MKTKEDWDVLVAELLETAKEKHSLKEESAMLADENIQFADFLSKIGYNTEEIDNIAKGLSL